MANNGKQCLTIQEISDITGKAQNTIYRYIREGKLKSYKVAENGKQILTVAKEDIERFFTLNINGGGKHGQTLLNDVNGGGKHGQTLLNNGKQVLTTKIFKDLMDEYFEEKQSQLMRPLEDQAMFLAGKLQSENQFLKDKVEILLQEIERYKALPGPVEEVTQKLKEQETAIAVLETELTALQTDLQKSEQEKEQATLHIQNREQTIQEIQKEKLEKETILLEKEAAIQQTTEALNMTKAEKEQIIQALQKEKIKVEVEKENLLQEKEKTIQELQEAKERELAKLKENLEAETKEKQDLKIHLEEKEKEQAIIVDAWKKRLEDAEKPWWRKIFG